MKSHWSKSESRQYPSLSTSDREGRKRGASVKKSQRAWIEATDGYYEKIARDERQSKQNLVDHCTKFPQDDVYLRDAEINDFTPYMEKAERRAASRREEISRMEDRKQYVRESTKKGFVKGFKAGGMADATGITQGLGRPIGALSGSIGAYSGSRYAVGKDNDRDRNSFMDERIRKRASKRY